MVIETELNLSLTPGVASRLAKHPLLTDARPIRQRVVNTYYDTADQRLRRERVIVRHGRKGTTSLSSIRRESLPEGRPAGHGEWELVGTPGELDFSQVKDGTLRHLLESVRTELRPAFTASFTRSAWLLAPREDVRIELALDRGWIEAEGRRQAICEIRLELLSGDVADLFSTASELQTDLSLHPQATSKLLRGYRILAKEPLPVVKALPIEINTGMSAIAAFRTIGLACLKHLQSNEQGLRESDNPEFVHQARVAIRRLRSAIRVWKPLLPQDFVSNFDPLWQALARQLGETRNWDVFLAETLPSIVAAFPDPEGATLARLSNYAQRRCAINRQAARSTLKTDDYSRLLLEFTAAILALPEGEARPLDTFVPRCLNKRAKQVRQLAAQARRGDATARHRLRVAYKRLRYALEFFASLFPGERLRDYHLSASGLQEMLGRLNDLAVASELIHEALPGEQGEDIRCWLDGQAEQLLPELGGLLNDFHQQAAPWKESLVVA